LKDSNSQALPPEVDTAGLDGMLKKKKILSNSNASGIQATLWKICRICMWERCLWPQEFVEIVGDTKELTFLPCAFQGIGWL
jgi:hypothetical protein